MIWVLTIIFLWISLLTLWWNYFAITLDYQVNTDTIVQNNLIVYGQDDLRLTKFKNRNNKFVNDIWETWEQLQKFKFISWEKATNFIQLDLAKLKWKFTISLSSPCKITGVVYRNNQDYYDVQLVQSLNKYTITSANNKAKNYADERQTLLLNDDAFDNDFAEKWQNKAYYFHANKELPVRQITFASWNNVTDEVKDITILMFLEPVQEWWTVAKRSETTWYAEKGTVNKNELDGRKFKEIAKTLYNQDKKLMHKEVRYMIAAWEQSEIALRNFVLTRSHTTFWVTNGENRVIINRMSPLIFYINEFQDVTGWDISSGIKAWEWM